MPRKPTGTVVEIKGRFYARWTVDEKRVYGEPKDTFAEADRERVNNLPPESNPIRRSQIPSLEVFAHQVQSGEYGDSKAYSTKNTNETIRIKYIEGQPIGRIKLHKLTRSDCQKWVNGLNKSSSYVRRCAAFLSKVLSLAVEAEYRRDNPMKGVRLPEVEERENRTLSPDEAVKLLNPATRTDAIMLVAMHTGMRRGELLRLEWRHVGADTVKVPGTKTLRSRAVVPLTPEAKAAMDQQPRRSQFVFTTESGKPLSPRNLTRDIQIRKRELGLPKETRLQDLRGSYVSLLIEQGADLRTVMELARHSDLRTTMKAYARSREIVKIEAVERLRKSITSPEKVRGKG